MSITCYTRPIQYYETDRMGVVHHSNYIRWMEEARVDFMNQCGLPYAKLEQRGIMMPVLSASCQYKVALHFGESFSVKTIVKQYNGFKLILSYEIYHADTGTLCATGETMHCFTDANMKPSRLKTAHPDLHLAFQQASQCTISDSSEHA